MAADDVTFSGDISVFRFSIDEGIQKVDLRIP